MTDKTLPVTDDRVGEIAQVVRWAIANLGSRIAEFVNSPTATGREEVQHRIPDIRIFKCWERTPDTPGQILLEVRVVGPKRWKIALRNLFAKDSTTEAIITYWGFGPLSITPRR